MVRKHRDNTSFSLGKVYIFLDLSFKRVSDAQPYYNLCNGLVELKRFGNTFKYRRGDLINEIFDKPTMSQLNKLLTIDF